jgi:hypothetical protein
MQSEPQSGASSEDAIRLSDNRTSDVAKDIRLSGETASFSGVSRIPERREVARQYVSLMIVSSLLFIVVASFGMLVLLEIRSDPPFTLNDLQQFLQILLAPVVGIVGAVTGFYFGSASAMRGDGSRDGNQ